MNISVPRNKVSFMFLSVQQLQSNEDITILLVPLYNQANLKSTDIKLTELVNIGAFNELI